VFLIMPSREVMKPGIPSPVLVRLLMHLLLLSLEVNLRHSMQGYIALGESPEETRGLLSRVFFTWINPILLKGYERILIHEDLPPVRSDMRAELSRKSMLLVWEQRGLSLLLLPKDCPTGLTD